MPTPRRRCTRCSDFRFVPAPTAPVAVEMPVAPGAFNGSGNLHGGAIATLVDVASGSAAAPRRHASARARTPWSRPICTCATSAARRAAVVRAEARVMRAGRQLIVVECRVADELGNVIAFADFSAMIVPLRQPLRPDDQGDVHVARPVTGIPDAAGSVLVRSRRHFDRHGSVQWRSSTGTGSTAHSAWPT